VSQPFKDNSKAGDHCMTMKKLFSAAAIAAAVCAMASEAQASRLRGRCHSMITGTDLGFVYGATYGELMSECGKRAVKPIVDNVTTVP
jgi:hypothetical protein